MAQRPGAARPPPPLRGRPDASGRRGGDHPADALIEGLKGALAVQTVGDPADPRTDIGPVIDPESRRALETRHAGKGSRTLEAFHSPIAVNPRLLILLTLCLAAPSCDKAKESATAGVPTSGTPATGPAVR